MGNPSPVNNRSNSQNQKRGWILVQKLLTAPPKIFIKNRIINHPASGLAIAWPRNAVNWDTVSIIQGAINRVNVPFVVCVAVNISGFLGVDRVIGKCLADFANQVSLRGKIGVGDQVCASFIFHTLIALSIAFQNAPGMDRTVFDEFNVGFICSFVSFIFGSL